DSPAFQILRALDARPAVDENVSEAKLAVGKRGDRNMLLAFCERAHPRGKTAVPGIRRRFVVDELPLEAVDLHRAVGDRQIGIDGRLAKIEFQFWIGHALSPFPQARSRRWRLGFYHQSCPRHSGTGKLFRFRIAISRTVEERSL